MAPPSELALESAAIMAESIMIGAYAVLTALVLWLLVQRRRTMPIAQKLLFVASVLMFVISVAHLALVFQYNTSKRTAKNGQARVILSIFQFVIGDLILIWRLWVVWAKNYWIIAPPLIIMAIAAGFQFKVASDQYLLSHASFFGADAAALIVANTSICTILIAGKIWYSRYQVRELTNGKTPGFSGTILLFIESGALYAASQICSLILNRVKSNGLHILLDLEIPLIGILPTLIIVIVHFELSNGGASSSSTAPSRDRLTTLKFAGRERIYLDTVGSTTTDETAKPNSAQGAGKGFDVYSREGTMV